MNYMTQYDGAPQYGYPGQNPEQMPEQPVYPQQQAFPPQYSPFPYADPYANAQQPNTQQPDYPQQPAYGQYPGYGQQQYPGYGPPPYPYEQQPAYMAQNPYAPNFIPPAGMPPAQQNESAKGNKGKQSKLKKFLSQEEKPDTLRKKILRVITNIGFWALCILMVGGSILFTLNKDPNKDYFGYRAYNVRSNSMAPNEDGSSPPGGFYKGDTILVEMVRDPQQIKEGDIVTFNPNPNDPESTAYLTHRVVRILNELGGKQGLFFVTKGDHNKSEDPPIAAASVIGKKVFMVPKVGTALELIRKNFAIAVVMILALFGSVLMLQWYFAKPNPNAKGKKAKQGKDEQPGTPLETPPFHSVQSISPG